MTTLIFIRHGESEANRNNFFAGQINPDLMEKELNTVLHQENMKAFVIGPGRWGSSDTALGIPVKWPNISQAKLIVESSLSNYLIEPSQGTHFFQNLTSFGVGYFTINPHSHDGIYDIDYLNAMPAVYESDYVRIVKFEQPLSIGINGRKGIGVVAKPNKYR